MFFTNVLLGSLISFPPPLAKQMCLVALIPAASAKMHGRRSVSVVVSKDAERGLPCNVV